MSDDEIPRFVPEHGNAWGTIRLSGNAPVTVFPFFTVFHNEVILRHEDDESQDVEMTPDEADQVADMLKAAAAHAREQNKKRNE